MKRIAILLASVLLVGVVCLPAICAEMAKAKTHDMTVEFVSFDAKAKTITFKTPEGQKSAPVAETAVASLAHLKAGDKITITCTDNEAGEHQAISMVKPAMEKKG